MLLTLTVKRTHSVSIKCTIYIHVMKSFQNLFNYFLLEHSLTEKVCKIHIFVKKLLGETCKRKKKLDSLAPAIIIIVKLWTLTNNNNIRTMQRKAYFVWISAVYHDLVEDSCS